MVQIQYLSINNDLQDFASGDFDGGLLNFSVTEMDTLLNNNDSPEYVSFDGNGIDLQDTSKKFYESGDYAGFVSKGVSDESCKISQYISVWVSDGFDLSQGLTIKFYGDCCRKIFIQYCNEQTEAIFEEYFDVSSDLYTIKSDTWCSYVRIYFIETALPNQFIKISHLKFGSVILLNKFKNIGLLEEINVLSEDLPINALECSAVMNEQTEFKENDLLYLYSNNKYYGTFYLDDAERISRNIYSIRASNCIKKLEESQFNHWDFMSASLNHFLLGDSENAGYSVSELSGVKIVSDDDLSNVWVYGFVPYKSCRYALCALAYAGCYMVDASRSDKVSLRKIPDKISSVITTKSKRIIGECTYKKRSPVSKAVLSFPRSYTSEDCEIKCENKSDKWYEVIFPNPPTYIDETKIIGNRVVGARSLTYMFFQAEEPNLTLKGQNYGLVKGQKTINNFPNVINGAELKFDKFDVVKYIENNGVSTEDKENDIKKYIQSGGTVKAKIRLRGERVGDLIEIETAFDGMKTGIITSMGISFGYEDVADIEVLEWQIG